MVAPYLYRPRSGTYPESESVIRGDAGRKCYVALIATINVLPILFGTAGARHAWPRSFGHRAGC